MPRPPSKRRLCPQAVNATPQPIGRSNETARAFLGMQQPSWITSGAGSPSARHPASYAESQSRKPSFATKPSSPHNDAPPTHSRTPSLPSACHDGAQPSVFPSPAPSGISSPPVCIPTIAQGASQIAQGASHSAQLPQGSNTANSPPQPQDLSPTLRDVPLTEPVGNKFTYLEHTNINSTGIARTVDGGVDLALPPDILHTGSTTSATPPGCQVPGQHMTVSRATKRTMTQAYSAPIEVLIQGRPGPVNPGQPAKRLRGGEDSSGPPAPPGPGDGWFTSRQWLTIVSGRLQSIGGFDSLDPSREKPRYKLLFDACVQGDIFYVVLHQLFCLWSDSRELVYAWLKLGRAELDSAFTLLTQTLRDNLDLPSDHLHWFATFPLGFKDLAKSIPPRQLTHVLAQIDSFLRHFVTGWGLLVAAIDERRFPLLVWELQNVLMCTSPILQGVLFTSSRRRLNIADGESNELNQLFAIDRNNESGPAGDNGETARVRIETIERYRKFAALAPAPGCGPIGMSPQQVSAHDLQNNGNGVHATVQGQPTTHASVTFAPPSNNFAQPGLYHNINYVNQNGTVLLAPHYANTNAAFHGNQVNRYTLTGGRHQPVPAHAIASHQSYSPNVLGTGPVPTGFLAGQVSSLPSPQLVPAWSVPQRGPNAVNLASQRPPPNARPVPQGGIVGARQIQSPRNPHHTQHRTVPLREHEMPQTDLQCIQNGLHLWSLRSPKRIPSKPCSHRYYQFFSHFAVEPTHFPPRKGLRELKFSLSELDFSKMIQTSCANGASTALYSNRSLRYRLRLSKQDRAIHPVSAAQWSICSTFWPPHIFVALNSQPVRPRRRQHFQHDLPIELSDLVRPGENTIEVSLPDVPANVDLHSTYYIGVEVVTTLDHGAVRALVQANEHVTSDEIRREIKRRLTPNDSDDIIIQDDYFCVAVADPFSSRLFKTPVRGVNCKHIECFDMDIWLETRSCKPSPAQGEPTVADAWKCPICGLDARPISLRIDDFFTEVQQQLAQSGGLDTKQICIKVDGSWNPMQDDDEVEKPGTNFMGLPEQTRPSNTKPASPVLVVLDDD